MTTTRIAQVSALLILLGGGAVMAAPTPMPGGANQTSGVSGTLSQALFNGTLRLRAMSFKVPVTADNMHPNAPGDRALVFHGIVSNGSQDSVHGFFNTATLADANGITVNGRPLDDGWELARGTAARTRLGFSVPADFVPTKLVLIPTGVNPKAFRITLRPADIPAASADAPASAAP